MRSNTKSPNINLVSSTKNTTIVNNSTRNNNNRNYTNNNGRDLNYNDSNQRSTTTQFNQHPQYNKPQQMQTNKQLGYYESNTDYYNTNHLNCPNEPYANPIKPSSANTVVSQPEQHQPSHKSKYTVNILIL